MNDLDYEKRIDDIQIGFSYFESEIKKLLSRREDLKFDWRKDLVNLLIKADNKLMKIENT